MNLDVAVRSSPIEGVGVFAARAFTRGEVVLAIDDSHIVDSRNPIPPGEDERHCDYLQGGKTILMQIPERYINHCCDPNVYVQTVNGIRLVLALKPIATGEEIAYDYCVNGYGDVVWNCNCGASRCRRIIHSDFFHLPLELQREYLPLLDDWFRRERASEIEKLEKHLASGLIKS